MWPRFLNRMSRLQSHLRKTFLAGVFAAVPVVVTAFVFWYVDHHTRVISERLFGRSIPVVGIVIALLAIYLGGLVATTLLGRWAISLVDRMLSRLPGFRQLYVAWKQVALTPGGGEGMFAKVVLIAEGSEQMRMLGFTSGQPIGGDMETWCVFVPNAPNPLQGRLYFVDRSRCQMLNISAEEAFKTILSTGNYLPEDMSAALGPGPAGAPATALAREV
jgi:uncharacterized membrane protein